MTDFDPALSDLLAKHNQGVLATIRGNGRPQLSVVTYTYDPDDGVIRVSITADRAKTANLRRDPRATFEVTNTRGWGYAVADGEAELSPVAQRPDDATVEELIDVYRAVQGEHPDWDDFRAAMVRDRRVVLTIRVDHVYGAVAP
ncbi:MAG: PPOX class F420-dependent oxidoreductase [Streptosporangiales bacterium]|nr:PPOX class F420-dependent oxidoreductase [Streptosporangiales bacterium]MBO0891653.1 PPOX class F420-dependent oxidoreductase [Acidothermales bacterium]